MIIQELMMTFENKVTEIFNNTLSIKVPSVSKSNLQYYADYIELVCLITNDYVSQADIKDRLADEGEVFKVEEVEDGEIGTLDAEDDDKAEIFVNTCFSFIKSRFDQYKKSYPFIYDEIKGIKLIKKNKLTNRQKLYIYLLVSSSLNSFGKLTKALTDEFEALSENALKNFLPDKAVVYGFGSNSVFRGNARTKINDLAKKLKLDVNQRIIDQVSLLSSKEEGLDIIGYIPFEDDNPNTIIILGQCACGKEWFGKQNEPKRYDRFYTFYLNPFTYALFSPRDFENKNNRFSRDKDLTNGQILFERRRLINLSDEDIINSLSQSKVIVEHCIDYVEDIV